jgi:4-amino-4-deoxy-L-arabinose transferase-like glycosyltransferase
MTIPTLPRPVAPPPRETGAHSVPPRRTPTRLLRGRPDDPIWARPAALTLLISTAVLYLWNLSASGWANSYYAAAVQAGTQSWKAFLFGSLDAGNIITVDKTPASLWVMELSGRIFGFSSWSMLAPQALEGVAAVGLLYLAVRRVSGPATGLVAGAALALTPVAALMFRFNNPDALLVLLLVASAWCTVRALERATDRAGTRWLMLAGVCLGFGFLTKMLQAFLVLPALGVVFLLFAAGPVRRRIAQLLLAGLALVASAGWWVALVQLWPASSRPYFGGSTNNSVLELALGYNGLSRILGNTGGGIGGGAGGGPGGAGGSGGNTGFGGASGLLRMFGDSFGTEVSWLLPAALLGLAVTLWTTRRAARTDLTRAGAVLWGLWLLVTAAVFSFMSGTVHPYYAVALAPAIAALVATGGQQAWQHRDHLVARIGLASMVASTGIWGIALLARTPAWHPELRYTLVPLTVVAAVAVLLTGARARARLAGATLVAVLLTGLAATGAYAVQTAAVAHSGSIPTSGPSGSAMGGGMRLGGMPSGVGQPTGTVPSGTVPTGTVPTGTVPTGTVPTGTMPTGTMPSGTVPGGAGRSGGESSSDSAVVALLRASRTTWAAATTGAQSAASLELSSGTSVIGIGGFTGSDPAPTLAQFKALVAAGQVHYFVVSGGGQGGGPGGGSGSGSTIQEWVAATFTATTVGNATVYDLTSATS